MPSGRIYKKSKSKLDRLKKNIRFCVDSHACPGCGFGGETTRDIMILIEEYLKEVKRGP